MNHVTRTLCICTLLSMLFNPISAFAQRGRETESGTGSEATQGMLDGRLDAIRDVNGFLWFGCGCTFLYLGVGAALIAGPSPKQYRFMGKSQDYIWSYTKQYKKTSRGQQTKWAAIGCTSGAVIIAGLAIAISASEGCDPGCGLDDMCGEWNQTCEDWNTNITNCNETSSACGSNLSSCGDINCSTPNCGESTSCGDNPSCGSPSG